MGKKQGVKRMKTKEYKQVIVIRTDLKMGKGKMVAQGCHASVNVIDKILNCKFKHTHYERDRMWYGAWMMSLYKKICVRVNSKNDLLDLYGKAVSLQLPCEIIRDAGLTQVPEDTYTALAIGPAPEELIDEITKGLGLL